MDETFIILLSSVLIVAILVLITKQEPSKKYNKNLLAIQDIHPGTKFNYNGWTYIKIRYSGYELEKFSRLFKEIFNNKISIVVRLIDGELSSLPNNLLVEV